ncbi:MAG: LrgB family protein [Anaerolineae bacterium]|nr:LrgB family protein [Anaerolineae bacterium]
MQALTNTWVYLAQTPLLWLTITLIVYQLSVWLYQRLHSPAILNPIITSIVVLVSLLLVTGTPYDIYFEGAQFVHFLLGPATVALAVPLYRYHKQLIHMFVPVTGALIIGSTTGILSAVGIGWLFNLSPTTLLSLAPKSITTPIAMGVAERIGGLPSLTTVFVILTGIIGALLGQKWLTLLRVKSHSVRGFAMGLAAHGLGTAVAFQEDEEAGAFSGLAMGLNGAVTALLIPVIIKLIGL